jgi:hypothetical protein
MGREKAFNPSAIWTKFHIAGLLARPSGRPQMQQVGCAAQQIYARLVRCGSIVSITAPQHWRPVLLNERTLRERSRTTLRFRFCPQAIQWIDYYESMALESLQLLRLDYFQFGQHL